MCSGVSLTASASVMSCSRLFLEMAVLALLLSSFWRMVADSFSATFSFKLFLLQGWTPLPLASSTPTAGEISNSISVLPSPLASQLILTLSAMLALELELALELALLASQSSVSSALSSQLRFLMGNAFDTSDLSPLMFWGVFWTSPDAYDPLEDEATFSSITTSATFDLELELALGLALSYEVLLLDRADPMPE